METKKAPKADLENKKNIFLEIGFLVALAVVFVAFEWKAPYSETSDFITVSSEPEDEVMIPITQNLPRPPQPPPPAPALWLSPEIVDEMIEENDVELSDPESKNSSDAPPAFISDAFSYGEEDTNEILPFVPLEDMPQFDGNLQEWLRKHINYPKIAMEMGIQGRVFIKFVVEKDGSISNVEVMRSVDEYLDKEAIRVIQSMPKWKPGKQRTKPVRVSCNVPIVFELR